MPYLKDFNIGVCVVLLCIFIYLLHINIISDTRNKKKLNKILSHKEIVLPEISVQEKLLVESIIEDYWKKRSMNKSNYAKIMTDVKSGISRGVIAGAIVGGGVNGAIAGAIVYGTISGISKAYTLQFGRSHYLITNKQT